jgi:hypothetical protein
MTRVSRRYQWSEEAWERKNGMKLNWSEASIISDQKWRTQVGLKAA